MRQTFEFRFDPRFRPLLLMGGITPSTSRVVLDGETFRARFGFWHLETPIANLKCHHVTRDYKWYKAIGPRGSFVDRGLTFGTNADAGVCVCFHEPVPALVPGDIMPHPAVTVTLADIDGFTAALESLGVAAGD